MATATSSQSNMTLSSTDMDVQSLQAQAEALRQEAEEMRAELTRQQSLQQQTQQDKVDAWIDELFFVYLNNKNNHTEKDSSTSSSVELLQSVDQVMEQLRDQRFSQEQVNKMFNRICEQSPGQSRSHCSPLMETLVDAVGLLDSVDRPDNPNKRWSGKVECRLRKRLFAMDWGMDLEDDDDNDDSVSLNPWRLR